MADAALVESFIQKWGPHILAALDILGETIRRAGYATALPVEDLDPTGPVPRLMWIMQTWYPSRPPELESMDVVVTFSLLPADAEGLLFAPMTELLNVEGSFADDVPLGEPLRLDDDQAVASALAEMQRQADHVATLLEAYFPRATKRKWKIQVMGPHNVRWKPSITTNEDFAKAEVLSLLDLMLDRVRRLFWELEAVRMYYAWNSRTTFQVQEIELLLEDGEIWEALQKYQDFVKSLTPALRRRVILAAGSVEVETTGGYE